MKCQAMSPARRLLFIPIITAISNSRRWMDASSLVFTLSASLHFVRRDERNRLHDPFFPAQNRPHTLWGDFSDGFLRREARFGTQSVS
jgi:hypothetical protein